MKYVTIADMEQSWRELEEKEKERAEILIDYVSDRLREEAKRVNKNLDILANESISYKNTLKSIVIDIVGRTLLTSTNSEPMTQTTESALGYSLSGTYLVPGGGIFIKNSELAALGLKRQKYGAIDIYGIDKRDYN